MDYLSNGDLFGFVMASYTDILGAWTYVIIFGIFIIMIYLKTQGFEMPFIIAFIIAGALGPVLPVSIGAYYGLLLALASAVILVRAFKS